MSDDDLNLNEEEGFLMPTRERRSTAGNKMKKLLEEELQEMQSRTELLEEDEMDLLFKEEVNDEDFEMEGGSSGNEGTVGQNVEEETGADEMDEMFSESEEDSGEQDEDNEEGERSLQRQEKLESRKLKQKRKMRSVMKRKRPKTESEEQEQEEKKKAQYEQIKAETLLTTDRRTSQRSSVVANKMKVYEKLSRAEKKRKIIQDRIRRHKESQKEEILSQEDRICIAMETEKVNILSLGKYREQEISKKQSRIALQQRQKMKFKPGEIILRKLSCTWEVTPLNEIEEIKHWEEQLRKREKKKKRYSRRPHKKQNLDPKKEEKEVKVKKEINEGSALNDSENNTDNQLGGGDSTIAAINTDAEICEVVQVTQNQEQNESRDIKTEEGNIEKSPRSSSPPFDDFDDVSRGERGHEKTEECFPNTVDEKKTAVPNIESKEATSQPSANNDIIISSSSGSNSAAVSKQISFANEPQINMVDSSSRPSSILSSSDTRHDGEDTQDTQNEEEPIYEGPEQLVGKNFVTLYSFPTESYHNDINKELFGENWTTGSSHRSFDVQTICKLTMPEGKIDVLDNASLVPNLSFLNKFPSFGEYDKKVVHDADSTRNKELRIVVKTAPPTGVFLPNGFRKKCLVSSKECQYFDPKNGVPYSDVETYKTIQDLQDPIGNGSEEEPQPRYQWFGFGNGGIYLDVGQRPAKGVPDGF